MQNNRYGPVESKSIFIERKTHHAAWLDGASVKDRFRLDESQVNSFVRGQLSADKIADDLRKKNVDASTVDNVHFIASGVQQSFREKKLEPMLRVFYNRTAFQLPGDQRLRISLDTDLTFIREDHLDGVRRREKDNWRRKDVDIDPPFGYLPEDEILRFPYAVLETKLQTHLGQEPPAWLTSLVESHLVHEVPRFSKYLHGACHFYRERLPLLPWWLSELNVDIRKPRNENTGLTRSRSFKPLIDGRYRRAMIEEKERANQIAVVRRGSQRQPDPQRLAVVSEETSSSIARPLSSSETLTRASPPTPAPTSKDPLRKRLLDDDKDTPPAWQPVRNSVAIGVPVDEKQNNSASSAAGNAGDSSNGKQRKRFKMPFMWNNMLSEGQPNQRQKVKVRVEPKVFFANERTFISWLQFCALLLTVALSLLNFGDNTSRIIGGIFIGLAAAVAIYALYRFEKRAWMINRRVDGRYDDLWGPAVLCTLLVGALIVSHECSLSAWYHSHMLLRSTFIYASIRRYTSSFQSSCTNIHIVTHLVNIHFPFFTHTSHLSIMHPFKYLLLLLINSCVCSCFHTMHFCWESLMFIFTK